MKNHYSINNNNLEYIKLKKENKELREQLEFWQKSFSSYYDSFHKINQKYKHLVSVCNRIFNKKEDYFIDRCFIDNCINEQKLS